MFDGGKLIAFLDGFVTDEPDLTDEMYAKASMHDENGAWQMLFGLNTLPEYRKNGYAGELLHRAVEDARKQGRKGAVLTCKQRLVDYYAKFCFVDEGVTDKSVHGGCCLAPDAHHILIETDRRKGARLRVLPFCDFYCFPAR